MTERQGQDLPSWATDECVEAVARAIFHGEPLWLEHARAAIIAAAPFVTRASDAGLDDRLNEYRARGFKARQLPTTAPFNGMNVVVLRDNEAFYDGKTLIANEATYERLKEAIG